jgi:hypothetical protein
VVRAAALALVLVLTLGTAPALAQSKLFRDYREDGRIDPCDYTPEELKRGLGDLPPDVEQYVPGLREQLRRGANCERARPAPQEPQAETAEQPAAPARRDRRPPPPKPKPQPVEIPPPPAPEVTAREAVSVSAPAVSTEPADHGAPGWVVAVLAGVAGLGLAAIIALRYGGLDPGGATRGLRASLSAAGERTGDALAGLRDRLRPR